MTGFFAQNPDKIIVESSKTQLNPVKMDPNNG